jgi:glutathione S-transferase
MSRYYMVNTTCLRPSEADRLGVHHVGERNFNTIELRVFRASLKKARLLAQIEFTHAAVMFCRVASMRDLNEQGFLTWLKSTDNRYPHLADWYGIRRRAGAKNAAPVAATTADAE